MAEWWEDPAFGPQAPSANETYWRQKLGNQGSFKNPPPRSLWNRFVDSISATMQHYSPAAAAGRAVARAIPIDRDAGVDQKARRAKITQDERDWREVNSQYDPANSVGDYVADLGGGLIGGILSDPTNMIAPGESRLAQAATQGAIGLGADAGLQGLEMGEGVRDNFDPLEAAVSAAGGPVLIGAGGLAKGVRSAYARRAIDRGVNHPAFADLERAMLNNEGGGSLAHPNVSPKGAVGPYQVMPETARKPGFGIKPWDGKSEADRARVGRQYLAVMTDRYDGDPAKILAAYNAGPGRVDRAIKLHGDAWSLHMPAETRAYIDNGLRQLGPTQGPDDLGEVRLAQDEMPDPILQKTINDAFAPKDDSFAQEILAKAEDNNIVDLDTHRTLKGWTDGIDFNEGPKTADQWDELTARERQDMDASVPEGAPTFDQYYEKFTPYVEKPNTPNNDWTKGAKEYTDAEWARLNNEQKQAALNLDNSRQIKEQKPSLPSPEAVQLAKKMGANSLDSYSSKEWEKIENFTPEQKAQIEAVATSGSAKKLRNLVKSLLKDDSGAYRGPGFDGDKADLPEHDPERRLTEAIKNATKVSAEQRKLYREERGKRAGILDKLQQEGGGSENYHAQLKTLKGELPKVDYESIRNQFSEDDIHELSNRINFNKELLPFEKVKALGALHKILGSEGSTVPTAGEIKLLSQVYSKDFVETLLSNRPLMEKVWHGVKSTLNVPRAIMSSFDLSAPLNQGLFYIHKKEWWQAWGPMMKAWLSESNSKALRQEIIDRPTWPLMKQAGLAILDPHSHYLAEREGDFMTDYAEKIPIIGKGVDMSNRAYTGFLNKLRADVFDSYVREYEKLGVNLGADPKKLKEIGRFINAATGRGDLGKKGNAAAPLLAAAFFSPRLIASRAYFLNPLIYMKKDPVLRKEAWKSAFAVAAVAGTTAELAKLAGLDVETDPRSADWLKVKVGNTRYDMMGGTQQYVRLAAQILSNSTKTAKGEVKQLTGNKEYKADTQWSVMWDRFIPNKFAPIPSLVKDYLSGKDAVGNDFNWPDAIKSRMFPMVVQDIADAYEDRGMTGIPMGIPSIPGVRMQTYKPKKQKESGKSKNWWDDASFGGTETPKASNANWYDDPAFKGGS